MRILPYNAASKSARSLASEMGVKRLRINNTRARFTDDSVTINWGYRGEHPAFHAGKVINNKASVIKASNKLRTFDALKDVVSIPKYTEDYEEAESFLRDSTRIISRETLTGHSGQGIKVLSKDAFSSYDKDKSKLFVEYIPKQYEYRYHVVGGKVIDKRRKARDRSVADEDVNWAVRNVAGGFIFAIDEGFDYPEEADDIAIKSIEALGLDFGAVDIVHNTNRGLFVLEINTAPGLEGRTTERYARAFKEMNDETTPR